MAYDGEILRHMQSQLLSRPQNSLRLSEPEGLSMGAFVHDVAELLG